MGWHGGPSLVVHREARRAPLLHGGLQLCGRAGPGRGGAVGSAQHAVPLPPRTAGSTGNYSVAARRRLLRGDRPGAGSVPRTYEEFRWFHPQPRHTSTV